MKADRKRIERALDRPEADIRCILLYGPDESGSRSLADRLARALGSQAERIDLTGAGLKADPARLSDEAAAISLFGSARFIRVESAGDESVDAVAALLDSAVAGNPVVMVAGNLRKDAKLVQLVTASNHALAFASYPIEGVDGVRLAIELARAQGIECAPGVPERLSDAAAGDRGVLQHEIEKLALFLDAGPGERHEAGHAALDALLPDGGEGDIGRLVTAVLSGETGTARIEVERLTREGLGGISALRPLQRRLLLLAQLRSAMDRGEGVEAVMNGAAARGIFWRDRPAIARQLARWSSTDLAAALHRLSDAERASMRGSGPGPVAIEAELAAIARHAARRR